MLSANAHRYHNRRWDEYARKAKYGAGEHETGLLDWVYRATDYLMKEIEVHQRLEAEGKDG